MVSIKVNLKDNEYNITIGNQTLAELGEALKLLSIGQDAVIITNPLIKQMHGKVLSDGLVKNGFSVKFFEVPDGEKSKSAKQAFDLISKIAKYSSSKGIFIIAFGGGVIGDLAGYVAAVYKRGVPYVQVPTTLLAQIDSAIGGKVAIDLPVGKNLVGAFYQPKVVWSDVAVLTTLAKRQIKNGLAEAIKYGIICDRSLFGYIEKNSEKLLASDPVALREVIINCSRIKAKVVENDERETKGTRTILNFGHTVGHAIETAGGYRGYHHGEAVALGMRVAANISFRLKLLGADDMKRMNKVISALGLPEKVKNVTLANILTHMAHDKKFKAGKNRFVLTPGVGSVKVVEAIKTRIISAAIKTIM